MNEAKVKVSSIQGTEDGYTVWHDGKKVAEKLSLKEAGELLDKLWFEEADVCSNFSPSLWR